MDSTPSSSQASNAPTYTVSELAGALKRTLETAYDHVRLRAEISKLTRHTSGHVYLTLKDEKSAIDAVIWKGQVRGLATQPETGLEVIATGRITTFPASSKYQLVIESLEVAGIGALLAQLERVKSQLRAEGLFEAHKKRPLPFAPRIIGVITSPTGAVIRDILHRIRDRWPCQVIVWPVVVQGDQAAPQVMAALRGFLNPNLPRPDVIIIARGGGSVEDLWAFNDEALARLVADYPLPIISAIGHETDTTLIDFVSDQRAPTPTGAAEMATPVFNDIKAALYDLERRRLSAFVRFGQLRRERLEALARALPKPTDMLGAAQQRLDFVGQGLTNIMRQSIAKNNTHLARLGGAFGPHLLARQLDLKTQTLGDKCQRLMGLMQRHIPQLERQSRITPLWQGAHSAMARLFIQNEKKLVSLDKLRLSLNPDRPLEMGFARVMRLDQSLVKSASDIKEAPRLILKFRDDSVMVAPIKDANDTVHETHASQNTLADKKKRTNPSTLPPEQGQLF